MSIYNIFEQVSRYVANEIILLRYYAPKTAYRNHNRNSYIALPKTVWNSKSLLLSKGKQLPENQNVRTFAIFFLIQRYFICLID